MESSSTTFKNKNSNHNYTSQRLLSVAQHLRLYKPQPSVDKSEETQKRAAVLICLFEGDQGDLRVILTRRSSRLSTYPGEVVLPGGKAEEGDKDDGETATREAKEEIGLDPLLVDIVTVLEPFPTKHNLRVIPVIGILNDIEAFKPIPDPAEVQEVFDAPLEMFIKDENRRVEEREWMGDKFLIHLFDYETQNNKYLIWGLTARILIKAASVVFQCKPAFLVHDPTYKFPRKELLSELETVRILLGALGQPLTG